MMWRFDSWDGKVVGCGFIYRCSECGNKMHMGELLNKRSLPVICPLCGELDMDQRKND